MIAPARPITRWPWLTGRRLSLLAALLAICTATIGWNHRRSQQRFLREIEVALPHSAAMTADALGDWVRVQSSYARAVAAVVGAADSARVTSDAVSPALTAAVAQGRDLRVMLRTNAGVAPAWPLLTIPASETDSVSIAEFSADVPSGRRRSASVVLRVPLTEVVLPHFNSAADDDRTQRTVLVLDSGSAAAPRGSSAVRGSGIVLLAVSHPGGGKRPPATRSFPEGLDGLAFPRSAYRLPPADRQRSQGITTGVTGARVVYGAARVPGTPWVLVREREVREFMQMLAPSLVVSDVVFATLTLLVLSLFLLWWRARYQQRERDATELRATFVAGVSHELRTPLTQIRMYAEMLRLELLALPGDRTHALQVIEKEAERLRVLIERALWFVRSGQAPVSGVPTSRVVVRDAVKRAVDTMSAIAADRQVQWQVTGDPALEVQLSADELHQVLLNLFDNAVKYGPVGQTITVSAEREGAYLRLMVTDQGDGISPADEATIWEPFRRGRHADDGTTAGTGIGLAVVRDIVERAGGQALVLRAPLKVRGTGASIAVDLPAVP